MHAPLRLFGFSILEWHLFGCGRSPQVNESVRLSVHLVFVAELFGSSGIRVGSVGTTNHGSKRGLSASFSKLTLRTDARPARVLPLPPV